MTYNEWVKKFNGKATDYDRVCGVQCVDLAKTFIKYVLGIEPQAIGNAIDYWTKRGTSKYIYNNFVSYPYKKGMKIQKGDICVFSSNSGYGHISVATGEYTSTYFYSYDQNYPRSLHEPMTKIKHDYSRLLGILRPKNQKNITGKSIVYKKTTAYLNAYSSKSFGKPAIVIPKGKSIELVNTTAGTMKKNGKSYKMATIKYDNKTYYVANMYLA